MMFDFKNFKELDLVTRRILISLACMMPFWYSILYFLNQDFFSKIDLTMKVISCFCLSGAWFVYVAVTQRYAYAIKKKALDENFEGVVATDAVTFLIIYFGFEILQNPWSSSFKTELQILFISYTTIRFLEALYVRLVGIYKDRKNRKP